MLVLYCVAFTAHWFSGGAEMSGYGGLIVFGISTLATLATFYMAIKFVCEGNKADVLDEKLHSELVEVENPMLRETAGAAVETVENPVLIHPGPQKAQNAAARSTARRSTRPAGL